MKSREVKRNEAMARNAKWAALPVATKLDAITKRPGECKKQLTRILRGMSNQLNGM